MCLWDPLYRQGAHAVQDWEADEEEPEMLQTLHDAVRARVRVIMSELISGVRQHFYSRQLWEDMT
jgi:hypothetical protein